jgi:hypothetical protein
VETHVSLSVRIEMMLSTLQLRKKGYAYAKLEAFGNSEHLKVWEGDRPQKIRLKRDINS